MTEPGAPEWGDLARLMQYDTNGDGCIEREEWVNYYEARSEELRNLSNQASTEGFQFAAGEQQQQHDQAWVGAREVCDVDGESSWGDDPFGAFATSRWNGSDSEVLMGRRWVGMDQDQDHDEGQDQDHDQDHDHDQSVQNPSCKGRAEREIVSLWDIYVAASWTLWIRNVALCMSMQ